MGPGEIAAHVGATYLARGRRYLQQGRVHGCARDGDVLSGFVQGTRREPYEVRVVLERGAIDDSDCSCPMQWSCKHVAAVLLAYSANPDQFGEVLDEAHQPDTSSRRALKEWAAANCASDLLDLAVSAQIGRWDAQQLDAEDLTIGAFLTRRPPKRAPYYSKHARERAQRELTRWLHEVSQSRARSSAYNTAARAWWDRVPEPALRPLYAWLRRAEEQDGTGFEGLGHCPRPESFRVQEDPPVLRIEPPGAAVPLQPPPGEPLPRPAVARIALDLLTHPDLASSHCRAAVLAQVQIRPWERALKALDAAVDTGRSATDAQGRERGWRVVGEGRDLTVEPVWTRPYKGKPGLRTWKASPFEAGPLASDQVATDALEGHRPGPRRHVRALGALVGHPRVVFGRGLHVAVREAELSLDWRPTEDGGVRLVPRLDGRDLGLDTVEVGLAAAGGDWLAFVQEADKRICVVRCSPALRSVLSVLATRGAQFPAEAAHALLQRFEILGALAPMQLSGTLRGEEVAADRRPLVRLTPAPDGALEVQVRSRALADAAPCLPGRGPDPVAAVRDRIRVYAQRERDAEPERFRAALVPIGLPEQPSFDWTLGDPELALPVVEALRAHERELQVEWTRPAPTVSRGATADDLKVRGVERRDWFGLEGGVDVDGAHVPLAALLAAIRAKRSYVRVKEGAWVRITQRLAEQLEDAAALTWTSRSGVELPPLAAAQLDPLAEAGAELDLPEVWTVRASRLRAADDLDIALPEGLEATLRPYQEAGFRWLARLAHWAPGAVLADDMGLGKTVQALALLLRRAASGPALVVAPASVGMNWLREAARFAPTLRAVAYRGSGRAELLEGLGPGDVLVTSWELMTRDADALAALDLSTVVLDEAQAIKNAGTRRARASASLGAGFTVALTGTPVENRVGEVWSLMRTVVPGLLGSAERFRGQFVAPIEREGDRNRRGVLSRLLRPFLLRRLKSQVARDLPPRDEVDVRIELAEDERDRYDTFRLAALAELAQPTEGSDSRFQILAALTRMRQLACDGRLLDPHTTGSSTKLDRLVRTIRDLREGGHKALVFSQFTTLLGLAREALVASGATVRYLDGSTPVGKRQAEVDAFQAGDGDVFLISLRAGGTGLNLTAASYVIHLDPWWNPATEDQATDRAHRIGQTQPVTVFRFVAADTIEEAVLALHADKRGLVADLLDGTGGAALDSSELLGLLQSGPAVQVQEAAGPTLLERFDARIAEEQRTGGLKRAATARNYRLAAQRLVAWVESQGGALERAEDVHSWGQRYLEALRAGHIGTGLSDKVFGGPAFRRLAELLEA